MLGHEKAPTIINNCTTTYWPIYRYKSTLTSVHKTYQQHFKKSTRDKIKRIAIVGYLNVTIIETI